MKTSSLTDSLQNSLQRLRKRLADHALYRRIETLPGLRIFMEHHIFAVCDTAKPDCAITAARFCEG